LNLFRLAAILDERGIAAEDISKLFGNAAFFSNDTL